MLTERPLIHSVKKHVTFVSRIRKLLRKELSDRMTEREYIPLKHWYSSTRLHGITPQMVVFFKTGTAS
jgi:hypothetical protein